MVAKRRLRGREPISFAPGDEAGPPLACPLCGRPIVPGPSADAHHLQPKSQGGREKFLVHRVCHRKIHATLSEKELARSYSDWASLRAHPDIAKFVQWLANKPAEFNDRSVRPRSRR
jgi:hypothetical protein